MDVVSASVTESGNVEVFEHLRSFYAAGKITGTWWRHGMWPYQEEYFRNQQPLNWEEFLSVGPITGPVYDTVYTGPFTIGCDHGCAHTVGAGTHCTVECSGGPFPQRAVFRRNLEQLRSADFLFVWAGVGKEALTEAHGTILEIGAAHAWRKPILFAHHPHSPLRDVWFAVEASTAVLRSETPFDALVHAVGVSRG